MVVGGGGGGRGGKVNLAYRVMGGFITAGEGKWLKCDREMDGCIIRGVGGGGNLTERVMSGCITSGGRGVGRRKAYA